MFGNSFPNKSGNIKPKIGVLKVDKRMKKPKSPQIVPPAVENNRLSTDRKQKEVKVHL